MRLTTKLLLLGGSVAGAMWMARKVRNRRARFGADLDEDLEEGLGEDLGDPAVIIERVTVVTAEPMGLSDVDPEPLTQFGEAIDPEATERAHEEIPAQRERLPRH